MRRTPITLLATVALAFGCANSNNQAGAENPDSAAVDSEVAEGEAGAGAGAEGATARKGKDQTGVRGVGIPNKAVKKLAAKKPPREDEEDTTPAAEASPNGLLAAYYPVDGSAEALPDFSTIGDAAGLVIVDTIDFSGDFPGLPESLAKGFAAKFMGSVNVVSGGEYNLCLTSSDGSMLALDGNLIVDNDGVHGSEQKCELVYMDPGEYELTVIYFNVNDPRELKLTWDLGGAGAQVVPNEALFKPEGADDLVK